MNVRALSEQRFDCAEVTAGWGAFIADVQSAFSARQITNGRGGIQFPLLTKSGK